MLCSDEAARAHGLAVALDEQFLQPLDLRVRPELVHQQPPAVVAEHDLELAADLEQRRDRPHGVDRAARARHADRDAPASAGDSLTRHSLPEIDVERGRREIQHADPSVQVERALDLRQVVSA